MSWRFVRDMPGCHAKILWQNITNIWKYNQSSSQDVRLFMSLYVEPPRSVRECRRDTAEHHLKKPSRIRQQLLNDHDVTCEFLCLEVFRLWIDWLVVGCLQVLCSVYPAVWLKVLLFYFFAHVHILTWYFLSFPLYSWCLIYLMKQIIGCDPGGRQDVLRLWVVF